MKIAGKNIDKSNYDLIIIICRYYVCADKIVEIMNKYLERDGLKFIGIVVDNKKQDRNFNITGATV